MNAGKVEQLLEGFDGKKDRKPNEKDGKAPDAKKFELIREHPQLESMQDRAQRGADINEIQTLRFPNGNAV